MERTQDPLGTPSADHSPARVPDAEPTPGRSAALRVAVAAALFALLTGCSRARADTETADLPALP